MTYDQWKTDSGYDERDEYDDYDAERDCEHENYEIDVCTGRAECDQCSHSWYLSSEDVDRELDRQARYQDDMDHENRRQWWRDRTYPVRMFLHRVLMRVWPRKSLSVLHDDEVPF